MAKRKDRKTKNAKVTAVAADKIDRGTVQTHARLTPDPLLFATLQPHRAETGLDIPAALEEGVGAQALDIIRIGMSSSHRHRIPAQRLPELRSWHSARSRRPLSVRGQPSLRVKLPPTSPES